MRVWRVLVVALVASGVWGGVARAQDDADHCQARQEIILPAPYAMPAASFQKEATARY